MSDNDDDEFEIPTVESLEETIEKIEAQIENTEYFIGHASYINQEAAGKKERRLHLDEFPLGEEQVRAEELLDGLNYSKKEHEHLLTEVENNKPIKEIREIFEKQYEIMNENDATYSDLDIEETVKKLEEDDEIDDQIEDDLV